MKKKILAMSIVLAMILQIVAPTAFGVTQEIETIAQKSEIATRASLVEETNTTYDIPFADQQLHDYVLEQYDTDKNGILSPYDMAQITQFNYTGDYNTAMDIEGLQYARHLQMLNLYGRIENASVLSNLTELTNLLISMDYTYEENEGQEKILTWGDVSFINTLPNLESVSVDHADLTNVQMPATINTFSANSCKINRLEEVLPHTENLQYLSLEYQAGNTLDMTPIANYTNLEDLRIYGYPLENAEFVRPLTKLKQLTLNGNALQDISPVASCSNLQGLYIEDSNVPDMQNIKGLTGLENLSIRNCNLQTISGIENLTNLTIVSLEYNKIKDITPLQKLNQLESISLYGNCIEDMTPLEKATAESIDASYQNIQKNIGEVVLGETYTVELPITFQQILAKQDSRFYQPTIEMSKEQYVTTAQWNHLYTDINGDIEYTLSPDKTKLTITPHKMVQGTIGYKMSVLGEYPYALRNACFTTEFYIRDSGDNTQEITIPDTNLKTYLLENCDVDNDKKITEYDMKQIGTLNLYYDTSVSNLQGLEYATNLQELTVYTYIDSITPILGLTNLERLTISCNNVEHIQDIGNMQNLTSLSLRCYNLQDISFVAKLQKLTNLVLDYGKIQDITPIQNLTKLTFLNLQGNAIEDITPLKKLENLECLYISGNQIEDGSFFEEKEGFSEYDGIYGQRISREVGETIVGEVTEIELPDIVQRVVNPNKHSRFYKPEATFVVQSYDEENIEVSLSADKTKLQIRPKKLLNGSMTSWIYLQNAGSMNSTNIVCTYYTLGAGDKTKKINIPDGTLKQLLVEQYDLDNNGWMSEFEMNQITYIYLSGDIQTVEGLQYAENLQSVSLETSEYIVSNMTQLPKGVEALTQIKELDIYSYDNTATQWDITPITKMKQLEKLMVYGNLGNNAEQMLIDALPNLKSLCLGQNENVGSLDYSKLTQLQELSLPTCGLTQIPNLKNMSSLVGLSLSDNHITDITPIKDIPNLEMLDINGNQVKDISIISQCPNLHTILVANNCIEDVSPYFEKMGEGFYINIGTQTVKIQIQQPITLGKTGYTISLPQVARYLLEEYECNVQGKGDVVFSVAQDNSTIQLLPGTIGPKMVLEIAQQENYSYNKVVLEIEATITDQVKPQEITFEDPDFQAEICKIADINGDGKLTQSELDNVTEIQITNNPNIESIKGVEHMKNLMLLQVASCSVKDISPIAQLENLQEVDVSNNLLTDITCLQNAKCKDSIYSITVQGNYIDFAQTGANYKAYVAFLDGDKQTMQSTFQTDIAAQHTDTVQQRYEEVTLEAALKTKLIEQGVDLDNNGKITKYELSCVRFINLSNASITNLSGLEYMLNVAMINLNDNAVKDITPLTKLKALVGLEIDDNNISSLQGIEQCTQLSNLSARHNHITDISPLHKLHYLNCDVEDTYALTGLITVGIDVSYNQIQSIEGVQNWKNLYKVSFQGNQISNIQCLQNYVFPEECWGFTMNFLENPIDVQNATVQQIRETFAQHDAKLLFSNETDTENLKKGDVNKDGKVSLYDAFKILETAILGQSSTTEQTYIMDYNGDNKVTLYDAFKFLEVAILG